MKTRILGITLLTAIACLSSGCSIFEMSDYDSFGEWFIGPPGMSKMFDGPKAREGLDCKRPWIYAHLRTPEVLFQPAGWHKYPHRRTVTNESMAAAMAAQQQANNTGSTVSYTRTTVYEKGPNNSLAFDWIDAGMIEIIPYRTWVSDKGCGYKIGVTVGHPFNVFIMTCCKAAFVAPVNIVHDVLKTVTIPVAAIYYATED